MADEPEGLSRREFARRDGCSESLVRQGLAKGKLVAFEDGTIDPALVGTPWRESARGRGAGGAQGNEDAMPLRSYSEAQRFKENYLAKLRQLEFEVKSGKLVDRAIVEKEVFALAREDRDAWQTWPAQVSPLMAADLGVDQVRLAVALEKYVRQHLSERADYERRFAVDNGSSADVDEGADAGAELDGLGVGGSIEDTEPEGG